MSVVDLKRQFYFIHNPKVAGTSIESLVGGQGHSTYRTLKREIPLIDIYFGFSFVRNPFRRVLSSFYHKDAVSKKFATNRYSKTSNGFKSFVVNEMKPLIGYEKEILWHPIYPDDVVHHHFLPQYFFMINEKGNVGVDFVGKLENLERDWSYVSNKLFNHTKKLPRLNRSTVAIDFDSHFDDPEVNDILVRFYKKDFELFGYDKNPRINIE